MNWKIINADVIDGLKKLKDKSVQCVVTSPPYFGLRNYGVKGQIGLEKTPEKYVKVMVDVFKEVKRVLRNDGTIFLNLGDSYYAAGWECQRRNQVGAKSVDTSKRKTGKYAEGLKVKDLIGIPWRVAFALQADGYYLRSDIIWCLSGGTWLYTRTQKGDMPMTVKDVARLDSSTVQLWNGGKWTALRGMSKNQRCGDEIELVLRSGERVSCTPTHRFPTNRGLLEAGQIALGDTLTFCRLPEPNAIKDCAIDTDAAWFAGLYIAEGSRSEDTIQISGHAKQTARWDRVRTIAAKYGGTATLTVDGNNQAIRIYGKVLTAILDEFVTGRLAKDKGFAAVVWRYSNRFLASMIDGYLSGDGHWDGDRWRLGFCRNYNLERDLRTACARLDYTLTLNLSSAEFAGRRIPTFRGELRQIRTGHHNEKDRGEVIEIRKARCRDVYDLGVADAPYIFALASGLLTHNSKPNPMPESVTDRCTKSHEYIFLMTKKPKYYYDADAIKEPITQSSVNRLNQDVENQEGSNRVPFKTNGKMKAVHKNLKDKGQKTNSMHERRANGEDLEYVTRNKRSVWEIATQSSRECHFAIFPQEIANICIKAGSKEGDLILDPFCGSGTTGYVALKLMRNFIGIELNPEYVKLSKKRIGGSMPMFASEGG